MDRRTPRTRRVATVLVGLVVAIALTACDSGGSTTARTRSTTRSRRHAGTTSTSAATSSTTATSVPSGQTGPGGTNPPATADCGVQLDRFNAVIADGALPGVPVDSYSVTDCRLAPSKPIWGAVTLAPKAGSSVSPLTVVFERIGSIWTVHSSGPGVTGCDAPAPVPAELHLGC